jgi:hypothetical protein
MTSFLVGPKDEWTKVIVGWWDEHFIGNHHRGHLKVGAVGRHPNPHSMHGYMFIRGTVQRVNALKKHGEGGGNG